MTNTVKLAASRATPNDRGVSTLEPHSAGRILGTISVKRIAANFAWLGQTTNNKDNSDSHHPKDIAIRALDAAFAQYGR